jgi:cellulose biosynthesis protein BcsS
MPYPGGAPWAEAWAGFGSQNNWYGGWGGFNYAFNHNVYSSGFLLRGEGGGGRYNYTNTGIPNGDVNVTYGTGSVLLGYRTVLQNVIGQTAVLSGYVGAEVQDHDNPDPNADVRGTEWGVKVLGDAYIRFNPYQDFWGMASFSSAFDTWMVIARPGFLVTSPTSFQVWVGPDLQIFANGHAWGHGDSGACPHLTSGGIGSCHYEQGKIGGFLHFINPGWTILGDVLVAGGYQEPMGFNSGPHGYYAQIGFYWPIR